MAKVSDMIGDFADPLGIEGYAVEHERAVQLANDMRAIMNADREEHLIAASAWLYNSQCEQNELLACWNHLNASERRAWRIFVSMGKC